MTDNSYKLTDIRSNIEQIALESGREVAEIELLAVSKGQSYAKILAAYEAGQRHFAENYLQDALPKIAQAKAESLDIVWHFIGQLQSNKTRTVAEHFDWCHSLSSLKHARRLHQQRQELSLNNKLNICVQVQFEENAARTGLQFDAVRPFLSELQQFENLNIRGLMCVLPADWHGEEIANGYQQLQSFFHALQKDYANLDTLSAGMSGDYPQAIRYGSTMVRLGTAIFGERNER